MIIFLPLLICLIGALMYGFCTNQKLGTLGLNMFWVGLLSFLLGSTGHLITVMK